MSWELFAIVGIVCLILEMVVPTMFFLNLALAGFLTAILALSITNPPVLIGAYVVFAILSLALLRPLLIKNKQSKEQQTGVEGKYIGNIAKVTDTITKNSGVISIYDERWEARTEGEDIPAGSKVKILRNDSLVMYVEKA